MRTWKFFMTMTLFASGLSLWGQQRHVGDIVMDYEFPAVVAYVDETGEHGLLLGLHKFPTCGYYPTKAGGILLTAVALSESNFVKGRNSHKQFTCFSSFYMPEALLDKYTSGEYPCEYLVERDEKGEIKPKKISGFDKKIAFEAYSAVASCGFTKGEEIASFINEYCNTHNIDKSIYFRSQYWTDCLGNGWFIPGDAELEMISIALCGHRIGEEYKMPKAVMTFNQEKAAANMLEFAKLSIGSGVIEKLKGTGVGYYFSPMIFSSNMTIYKNDAECHIFTVAGKGCSGVGRQAKSCKPMISSGFVNLDKKAAGKTKYGEWKCETTYGGTFFFWSFCAKYGFDVATLPVKAF